MRTKQNKIYIVEDDKFYAQLIQAFITNLGYKNNAIFFSGSSFLQHLDENPSLVILDYTLGLENGLEILKQIKTHNKRIKVIMLSGQEYLHVSVKAYKHGASDYIEKDKNSLKNLELSIDKILNQTDKESDFEAVF